MIQTNVIHAAHKYGVKKLLFLGSSCIYPKMAPQPLKEEYLLTGALEPTNEAYALAKIAGMRMCEYYRQQYGSNFIAAMPTNLYGYGDNFHAENSHVIPGMMLRLHKAKLDRTPSVTCWGSGTPTREFLFVDDLADAVVTLMDKFDGPGFVNIGTGLEVSISELAGMIADAVGYPGEIIWDSSKPDGTPRKVLDVSKARALGWEYKTDLAEGLRLTYQWFMDNR
jgi:GDP-L-fucose synthase